MWLGLSHYVTVCSVLSTATYSVLLTHDYSVSLLHVTYTYMRSIAGLCCVLPCLAFLHRY
jgi:hypothetical protein